MAQEIMYEFKILRGNHAEGKGSNGKQKIYKPGDVIKTKTNLLKVLASSPRPRVQLLSETPVKAVKA